ncbi:MAG: NfeD family protein [Candidatus Manganitrophaceae bacterium]
MPWWIWLLLGLFFVLIELLTPGGFYFIFFGIAATATGILAGVAMAGSSWAQGLLFSALSIATLLLFRKRVLNKLQPKREEENIDGIIGETAVAFEEIAAGAIGKVELRGTLWNAKNTGENMIQRNQRCSVKERQGLMLLV